MNELNIVQDARTTVEAIADRWESNPLATETSDEGRMTFQTRVLRYMQDGHLERARQKLLWRYPARKMKDARESNLFGKLGEYVWSDHLTKQDHALTEAPRDGYFPDYDLQTLWKAQAWTWEVKTDWHPDKTDNIPIELWEKCKGQRVPSGLGSTKADWYVVYFPRWGYAAAAKTEELKAWLKANGCTLINFQNGQSYSGASGKLIPLAMWERIPTGRIIPLPL